MKSKNTFLFVLFISISIGIHAQGFTHKFNKELKAINVIVLNLEGNVTIHPSLEKQIRVITVLNSKGDVWGLKTPKNRPEFKTTYLVSNDTLHVTTPKKFNYSSVGINTYSEQIETEIQVSSSTKIIVRKANEIKFEAGFTNLSIQEANIIQGLNVNKASVKVLQCDSKNKLVVNGLKKGNSFEYEGTGLSKYFLKANTINITLK
jgi:hypothetical protein